MNDTSSNPTFETCNIWSKSIENTISTTPQPCDTHKECIGGLFKNRGFSFHTSLASQCAIIYFCQGQRRRRSKRSTTAPAGSDAGIAPDARW